MLSKAKIKEIQQLHSLKGRRKQRLFIVEGKKMLKELFNSTFEIQEIYAESDIDEDKISHVDSSELKKISALKNPQECLAIVRSKEWKLNTNFNCSLYLDGIRDPGNMGTIIRTADWFGIEQIICSEDCVDVYNPKVVQATMGSIFRVPVLTIPFLDLVEQIDVNNKAIIGTFMEGDSVFEFQTKLPKLIVIGNEGNGISPEIENVINQKVTIPGRGGAESLNAGIAAGIVMAELLKPVN